MNLFTEPAERAKAMGVFGFVAAGGGSIGVLLGGILTDRLDWHWIFLVNLPIGVAVILLSLRLLPGGEGHAAGGRIDVGGAVTVTAALMLAVYAIVNGNQAGWTSFQTLGLLGAAAAAARRVPLDRVARRGPARAAGALPAAQLWAANVVGVLWAASMFAWFFLSALYLQLVLGYSPLEVGLAFLPANLIMGDLLARPLREDRHALRHQAAARHRAVPRRGRPRAVRSRAGRRELPRRRPSRA